MSERLESANDRIIEIEQFLYGEAKLLEERKFDEWLNLFTDDTHYWMPVTFHKDRGGREVADGTEMAFFDDDKQTLGFRVKRMYTDFAFAEDPPSRTIRHITNVQVRLGQSESEIQVDSLFTVFRSRGENPPEIFTGRRDDTLRKVAGNWKIARRKIILGQNVLPSRQLSIFL